MPTRKPAPATASAGPSRTPPRVANPAFSICIPTYNRASFLDDCLARLPAPDDASGPFEILVSDNGSTDDTQGVIARHAARNPAVRGARQAKNKGVWANILNAFTAARGDIVIYLADDDALSLADLKPHVERMQREPNLAAIYTDWISWDDQQGRELHRYFGLSEAVEFDPEDPLGLVNFVFQRALPPEIGLYRRKALLAARPPFVRAFPFHVWMYALSRQGRIRFDPDAFYREQRVPRAGLSRTHWANMDLQAQYIGDEMRLSLESTLLLALQDAGLTHLPADQMEKARRMIDGLLHARTNLEIERACRRGDFILAVELRRRQVLWNGPGPAEVIKRDVERLVLPAAAQSIAITYQSLSDVRGLQLKGFAGAWLKTFLAQWYPDIPVVAPDEPGDDDVLVVHRDEASLALHPTDEARNALVLERLMRLYRVARDPVGIGTL